MNERQAGEEQQGSFFLQMPARSQHLGLRLPERSSGVRGIWGRERTESSLCRECVRV